MQHFDGEPRAVVRAGTITRKTACLYVTTRAIRIVQADVPDEDSLITR